jgi:hypothetical protein
MSPDDDLRPRPVTPALTYKLPDMLELAPLFFVGGVPIGPGHSRPPQVSATAASFALVKLTGSLMCPTGKWARQSPDRSLSGTIVASSLRPRKSWRPFHLASRMTFVAETRGALFLVSRIVAPICESDDVGSRSAANTGANLDALELSTGEPAIDCARHYSMKCRYLPAPH